MDLATVELLTAPEGAALLAALPPYDEVGALRLGAELRDAGYAPELVAATLTQSRLRARAVEKFGDFAPGLLLTPDGLEQATRLDVAAHHAQRFRAGGLRHVLDLGCGIGGDALVLASLDLRVDACDADPAVARIADVNLRHFPHAAARVGRVEDLDLAAAAGPDSGAWLDPARRLPGTTDAHGRTTRVFRLNALSPSWEAVAAVAAVVPATGAKLAPSFPHARVPGGAEAQWVSRRGEVLECVVWWGPLARHPGRTALVLGADGAHRVTQADAADGDAVPPAPADRGVEPGTYLYETDRAVTRAGLVGAVVAAVDGAQLAEGVGHVVSQTRVDVPFARRYVVADTPPLAVKPLRAWLRARGVGRVTLKARGSSLDPDDVRRRLRLDGRGAQATLLLTRIGNTQAVLALEPD